MPLLQPIREPEAPEKEILRNIGLIRQSDPATKDKFSTILEDAGLSRYDCAEGIKNIAKFSEKEELKLQAIKIALELHGDLKKDTETGNVQINIIGNNADNIAVLLPR